MNKERLIINNPDCIEENILLEEVEAWEHETGRKASRVDAWNKGDETISLKIWAMPVSFERIRRITGYIVGTLDNFNDAKREEEHDRVKHECGDKK